MARTCRIKVCGITSVADAKMATRAGADLIGVNLVPSSKRYVAVELARAIIDAVRGEVEPVAVVADNSVTEIHELSQGLPGVRFQLHGFEPATMISELGALAFKAMRIGGPEDIDIARRFPGDPLLVDARVSGELGGTGQTFDWDWVVALARERRLILAGGLEPGNVGEAVRRVRPHGVDVASGVERRGDPRSKDEVLVRQFVEAVREAEGS